jgi:amidase
VGLRPSPGRVTRGTSSNLWSPQSVQGPMARTVPDLALFLDTMAGFCPQDAMTFDAPAVSFSAAVAKPRAPKRIAWTPDLGGICEVDREIREVTSRMVRRFEEIGCVVDEVSPDFGPVDEVFMVLRSQQFVVDREMQIQQHRDKIKPDIIWNTELGLKQSASRLAWAERERAALFRRMAEFFQTYDLLVTPSAPTGAFDVNLRAPTTINGKKLDNYMGGSTLNSAITVTGSPAIAVPCGFDQYGRPVGLQLVGKPRGEAALLQAASLYENLVGLHKLLPIDPKPGTVPPSIASS